MKDEVGKFWVVEKPGSLSTLIDVCYQTDIISIMFQSRGGLNPADIVGIYKSKIDATKHANRLLNERDKFKKMVIDRYPL